MSKYSDEGTIAHALAAMCLTEGMPASAYVGRMIESSDYEHAKLSPSSAARWMRCPGSYALCRQVPFVPRTFDMQVTEDMAAGVQIYLDALASRVEVYYAAGAKSVELLIEQQLPIAHMTGEEGATGTGDVVIIVEWEPIDGSDTPTRLVDIVDLKFGRGVVVRAAGNEQLRMYASGAVALFELIYGEFDRVRYGISQPRLEAEIDDEEISIEELRQFEQHAKQRAFHARQTLNEKPGALEHHLNVGDKQCKFCDAKATCPKFQREVVRTVFDDFDILSDDAPIVPAEVAAATVRTAPDDNELLAVFMTKVDMIRAWCDAVASKVEAKILAGEQVAGFKAVQGRKGNREWSNPNAVEEVLKGMRVREDVMYKFSLISPAEAEKRLAKAGDYTPAREGAKPFKVRGTWWKVLESHITQREGSPTVVPESDKRPAIEIKPLIDDFNVIEEELF